MFTISGVLPLESLILNLVLSVFLAVWVNKKYGFTASLAVLATFVSGVYTIYQPTYPFLVPGVISQYTDFEWSNALSSSATYSLLSFLMAVFLIRSFSKERWLSLIKITAVINGALIFCLPARDGICLNASMSGCLNAVLLPLFFIGYRRLHFIPAYFVAVSVLFSGQSQPIALLFISIGVYFLQRGFWKWLLPAVGASVLVGYLIAGRELFFLNGRDKVWSLLFKFWDDNANPFLGMGLGSFFYIGPSVTVPAFKQPFIFMHSDWLQILFEQGIIGLLLVFTTYVLCLWNLRGNKPLFNSLAVFGCFGLANFPLHNPVSAIIGLVLIHWGLTDGPKAHQKSGGPVWDIRRTFRQLRRYYGGYARARVPRERLICP